MASLTRPAPGCRRSQNRAISCARTNTSSPALDQVGSIGALFRRKPTSPDFSMQDHSNPGISHGRCDERTVADTRQNVELALTTPLRHAGRLVKASPPYFENQMLSTQKTHIKHRFADMNEKGNTICKFVCQPLDYSICCSAQGILRKQRRR